MALTQNEIDYICNPALVSLAVELIDGITDTSQQATTCEAVLDIIVKGIITDHVWNSMKVRTALPYLNYDIQSITQANPGVITLTEAHDLPDDATIIIESVTGMTEVNDNIYTVTAGAGADFTLSGLDTSAFTAYVSGGTVRAKPLYEWDYWYVKPSNYLSLISIEDDVRSTVEGNLILTNERNLETNLLNMKYTKYDADPANYGTKLVDVLKYRLAGEVSPTLTENPQKTAHAFLLFQNALEDAIIAGACEDKDSQQEKNTDIYDTWIPTS